MLPIEVQTEMSRAINVDVVVLELSLLSPKPAVRSKMPSIGSGEAAIDAIREMRQSEGARKWNLKKQQGRRNV